MSKWGRLLGFAVLMIVIGLVPVAIGWSNLPDPVATHWGIGGDANGTLPLAALPLLQIGIVAIGLLTTSLFRSEGEPTPEAFAMLGLMGGLGLALNSVIVALNWGQETWQGSGEFNLWHLGVVLLAAFVGGTFGYLAGRRWYPVRQDFSGEGPTVAVAAGERVSWVGRTSVRWPLFILGGSAVALVLIPGWGRWLALVFLILGLLFMQVEANVNNDGLRIRLGGIPVRKYSIDAIQSASAIDLEPAAWGGWGWRMSANGSAVVLRRGDALEVVFRTGRRFAVTVDDAATGAALINGLVARSVREL